MTTFFAKDVVGGLEKGRAYGDSLRRERVMNWRAGFRYISSSMLAFAKRRPVVSVAIGIWSLLMVGNISKEVFDYQPRAVAESRITNTAPRPYQPPQPPAPVVSNSAWDGSVWQVERFLERNLKDPDSFEAIEWSPVLDTGDGFTVRCQYRARNGFGGMVVENKLFRLSLNGDVVSHTDF